ncbi:MAG: 3D domain-containing protein [Planctomycetota bacterium]
MPTRGSRHTQPFALALAGVVVTGTAIVAATLAWGVFSGIRDGESIKLMALEPTAADPEWVDPRSVAPSRPAPDPGFVIADPQPIAEELVRRERQLVETTRDNGPALGSARPGPVVSARLAPTFDGRPLRPVKTLRMLTTAYSPDARSCGKWADGITASGYSVWTNGMKLVAADTSLLPFGTIVTVPGYNGGRPVPVLDRGGVIKGARLDVLYPTHERALQWGAQRLDVTVWEYADE